MVGSVTEKVLRKAPCPVLSVPPRSEGQAERPVFGRILCGADFSEASDRAAEYALSLAQEANGRLTLLHVVDWMPDKNFARPQFDTASGRRSRVKRAGDEAWARGGRATGASPTADLWASVREILRIADGNRQTNRMGVTASGHDACSDPRPSTSYGRRPARC